MVSRRYIVDTHVYLRLHQRNMTDRSIWYAIKNATACEPYVPSRPPSPMALPGESQAQITMAKSPPSASKPSSINSVSAY
jgi:hypothetical protein